MEGRRDALLMASERVQVLASVHPAESRGYRMLSTRRSLYKVALGDARALRRELRQETR
ncbi:uncharacterized protein SCHCODRAFT_02622970 [Schizophyllum commune H4-8]|uniref:uncharacterized protein n=1 Tax=Schizophyllum commune (strain H4-8 / FGSC 9210) TaxID=578458 RepID=UPI00216077F4|nr:uncharacterized protein SCHCODRAFT_02622970 [Schizophyllum commune H4-8]KAI5893858.1 hypothetical protein SCHCODRAFT_02622970 [Schizophyllum commune H4-8]